MEHLPQDFFPGSPLLSLPKWYRQMGKMSSGQSITALLCCNFLLTFYTAQIWALHVPSGHGILHGLQQRYLFYHGILHGMKCLVHFFFYDLGAHKVISCTFFLTPFCLCSILPSPFLNLSSQRCHHLGCQARHVLLWGHWNQLEPSRLASGSPRLSSQRCPLPEPALSTALKNTADFFRYK